MPRFKTVVTIDGYNTFQLRPKDFVLISEDADLYRTTRTEIRKAIKALDKYLKQNKEPQPERTNPFTQRSEFPVIARVNTGYGSMRTGYDSFNLRYNQDGGISIGCMEFDKKTLNKIRTWATATAATTGKKKSAPKRVTRTKAAA
jgi:hypothetical protein